MDSVGGASYLIYTHETGVVRISLEYLAIKYCMYSAW